ncbi:MAG: hypothetical protein AMJ53_12520 [Gammaproteobacteria bacterium SG8_11]|nr:MAG: hypothetical protein AMJ53_12520 [Gammaproteobacteria bacterium SG8_11]
MIPNKKQWKKWTTPSKASVAGYWLAIFGIVLGTVYYFFPFVGVLAFFDKSRMEIPGDSVVEKKLNLAKIEGVKYKNPTNAYVIAKPITLPILNELTNPLITESWGNKFMLASVSPFKPSAQDTIFEPGQCRFLGKATSLDTDKMVANFVIEVISCVDSRVEAYEITAKIRNSHRIGYLARVDDIGNSNLPLSWRDKILTINDEQNVVVIFDLPVSELKWVGKSALRF